MKRIEEIIRNKTDENIKARVKKLKKLKKIFLEENRNEIEISILNGHIEAAKMNLAILQYNDKIDILMTGEVVINRLLSQYQFAQDFNLVDGEINIYDEYVNLNVYFKTDYCEFNEQEFCIVYEGAAMFANVEYNKTYFIVDKMIKKLEQTVFKYREIDCCYSVGQQLDDFQYFHDTKDFKSLLRRQYLTIEDNYSKIFTLLKKITELILLNLKKEKIEAEYANI